MKGEVKITVIATGFRADYPQKRERAVAAAVGAVSRTASSYVPPPSDPPLVNVAPAEEVAVVNTAVSATEAASTGGLQTLSGIGVMPIPRVNMGIVASVEASPASESDYAGSDPEDLDVPAFIRKRAHNV